MCKFFFIFFYNCESNRKILTAGRITNNCSGSGSGRLTARSFRYICESFSLFPPRMFPHLARSAGSGIFFPNNYSDVFTETGARSGNLPIRVSVYPRDGVISQNLPLVRYFRLSEPEHLCLALRYASFQRLYS